MLLASKSWGSFWLGNVPRSSFISREGNPYIAHDLYTKWIPGRFMMFKIAIIIVSTLKFEERYWGEARLAQDEREEDQRAQMEWFQLLVEIDSRRLGY